MKEIPLTRGQVALVDDEDFERFGCFKWHAHESRNKFYAGRNDISPEGRFLYLHREVMGATGFRAKVDHKNFNTLDCQKNNLRICTNSQNMSHLSKPRTDSKSGFTGVHWYKAYRKWSAEIQADGKRRHLGYFKNKEDAVSVRIEASQRYHGEFAGSI